MIRDGKAGPRAFIWEPNAEELEILASHPQITNAYLQLGAQDPLVAKIKAFAEANGRMFIIPKKDLELSVQPDASGNSAYSKHEVVGCLMGAGNAQKNAAVILQNGYEKGLVWFERPNLSKGGMRVRPLLLGGFDYLNGIDANAIFYYGRRARGVQQIR